MGKKLACIYMTHNHPDIVEDVLSNICDSYKDKGIDIIYYDSSEDDKTQQIVEKYISNGYSNIYYVDMRFTETADEKIIHMLKKYGFPKEYDYVWNSKDRCYFVGNTLDEIVKSVEEDHDVVFALCETDRWKLKMPKVKDVYTDPVEFFSHYGQLTTNWECLIRKTETMIDSFDWDECVPKYHMSNDNNFNQTISLFSCLSEMDKISVKIVRTNDSEKLYSMPNASSGWIDIIFDLWINRWIKAIYSLPSIYDQYKLKIIRDETRTPYLFGSTDRMIYYKQCGVLTREVFEKYRPMWNIVTDFPEEFVYLILDDEIKELYMRIAMLFNNAFKEHNYDIAYRIFASNRWLKNCYDEAYYNDMFSCFAYYKAEINEYGSSKLFEGINSPDGLIERYRMLINYMNEMTDKKITWCIPTYNRPNEVNKVLEKMLPALKKYGIDLYVYDSSSNDETENILEKHKSYDNFSYIRLPSDIKPVEKIRKIFTGYKHKWDYDYVWLVKDRVYCSEELLENIINAAGDNPDAIFLRAIETLHTIDITQNHYSDPVSLYHDWGWLITSWDCLLLSREKILNNVNWDEIMARYAVNGDISFILVVLLFDTLAKKEQCNVPVLNAIVGKHILNLPLSKAKSLNNIFSVWGYEWYLTNTRLPDIYNNEKEFVIKSAASLPWLIGNNIRLMELQQMGILTDKNLACVKDIWDKISDVSWHDVCEIQKGDRDYFEKFYVDFFWDIIKTYDLNMLGYVYYNSAWIRENIVSKDLLYTTYTFEILNQEIEQDTVYIFNGGNNKEFVFLKIDLVIKFLQVLEENEHADFSEIKQYIDNKLISLAMIVYMTFKTSKDIETMKKKLSEFFSEN